MAYDPNWRDTVTCHYCNAQDATTCRDIKIRDAAIELNEKALGFCELRGNRESLLSIYKTEKASNNLYHELYEKYVFLESISQFRSFDL